MERFISGELRIIFRVNFHKYFSGLTIVGKHAWQQEEVDPSLQDNVVIQSGFFHHIYHIVCAFDLHSIINSGSILGGQNSSKRQTVFFLLVDPRDKSHKDPDEIDLNVPRHARYLHNAWKRHQDAVYCVDIDLAIQKGLKFCQTRSMQSSFKEHFQLIVFQKLSDWKLEKSYTKK